VQLEEAIRRTAWDLGAAGPDNDYGNGFLDVERAAIELNILTQPVTGDMNGNGTLDLSDILAVLRTAVGFETSAVEMKRAEARSDVFPFSSNDGAITAGDALTLLRTYVGAQ
jgi:hypothetical protein